MTGRADILRINTSDRSLRRASKRAFGKYRCLPCPSSGHMSSCEPLRPLLIYTSNFRFGGNATVRPGSAQISGIEACGPRHFISGFISFFFVAFAILLSASTAAASASNVYISQNGTGTGTSCSDTLPVSWFNNSVNWGSGSTQIGPGTTAHLCGTFTGALNSTMLTFQGSGSPGNPITLLFEVGAQLTSPAWSSNGAINTNSKIWLTINGDAANGRQGIIQNTANGTGLANTQDSVAIFADHCADCIVKNIQIINIYVHTSVSDTSGGNTIGIRFLTDANHLIIDNILFHDVRWSTNGTAQALQVSNSEFYNVDHGATTAQNSSGTAITGIKIFGNHFHDYANWDTTANVFHHDGIHIWANTGGRIEGADIYNNLFDGFTGGNATAQCYIETVAGSSSTTHTSNFRVYNNVFLHPSTGPVPRMIWFDGGAGNPSENSVYNNFINAANSTSSVFQANGQASVNFRNNIVELTGASVSEMDLGSGTTAGTIDSNIYMVNLAGGNGNTFIWNGTRTDSLATWQGICSCDAHSELISAAQINATNDGHLQLGSLAIGAGTNLTSLGITALGSDMAGIARPSAGAWDGGAYQFGTNVTRPAPPTGLKVVVQ